jgi:hypothetical protein
VLPGERHLPSQSGWQLSFGPGLVDRPDEVCVRPHGGNLMRQMST